MPDEPIPEIRVRGRRIPFDIQPVFPFGGEGGGRQFPGREEDDAGPSIGGDPIDEIIVTGKKSESIFSVVAAAGAAVATPFEELLTKVKKSEFQKLLDKTRKTAFERLLEKPVQKKVVEEIVVQGSRSAAAASAATRFNIFTSVASVLGILSAKIAEEISQQKLESEFAKLMARDRTKPDSPLQTIPPDPPIPEIVVTGTRPFPTSSGGAPPRPPRPTFDLIEFQRPQNILVDPKQDKLVTPRPPQLPRVRPTRFATPGGALLPSTVPLPIGDLGGGDLTRFQGTVLPSQRPAPQTALQTQPAMAGFCPPCPKPTKRRKRRSECWRKLVKEARNPANDKEFKWVRIDCDTGREIKSFSRLNLRR
ncbi:MAG: hypothetical protein ACR2NU_13235 [Aeoliella sp.]